MLEVIFLGTSAMVPTKERNVQSIFISCNTEGILIDCGEGTQRQMNIANIKRNKITRILISHWHGDHVSGLIGLIQTLGNIEGYNELNIYGPLGTKEKMSHLLQTCYFDLRIKINIFELNPKKETVEKFFENQDLFIEAAMLDHGIPCVGYSIIEKSVRKMLKDKLKKFGLSTGPIVGKLQRGETVTVKEKIIKPDDVSKLTMQKKITFILDTKVCNGAMALAKDADILVSEAVYASKLEEKAEEYSHMTAKQAAFMAHNANVKKLILTHISQRYKTSEEVLEDAKNIFENSEVAFDFMKVKL
ncbi:MAG: ribonuclease Z [Candidatus Woesearchaeota archaeon]